MLPNIHVQQCGEGSERTVFPTAEVHVDARLQGSLDPPKPSIAAVESFETPLSSTDTGLDSFQSAQQDDIAMDETERVAHNRAPLFQEDDDHDDDDEGPILERKLTTTQKLEIYNHLTMFPLQFDADDDVSSLEGDEGEHVLSVDESTVELWTDDEYTFVTIETNYEELTYVSGPQDTPYRDTAHSDETNHPDRDFYTCDEPSAGNFTQGSFSDDDSSCDASETTSDSSSTKSADWEHKFVYPKAIPSPTDSYRCLSLSFLALNVPTGVAAKIFDEALRVLKPGGVMYVVDLNGATVNKLPKMRQMLRRIPGTHGNVQSREYEAHLRTILEQNGFEGALEPEKMRIVRWMGKKL